MRIHPRLKVDPFAGINMVYTPFWWRVVYAMEGALILITFATLFLGTITALYFLILGTVLLSEATGGWLLYVVMAAVGVLGWAGVQHLKNKPYRQAATRDELS